jgi:hypothetical protein
MREDRHAALRPQRGWTCAEWRDRYGGQCPDPDCPRCAPPPPRHGEPLCYAVVVSEFSGRIRGTTHCTPLDREAAEHEAASFRRSVGSLRYSVAAIVELDG